MAALMCACTASFTCSKCAGTPFDPRYEEDAHEPMGTAEFDGLVREDTRWTMWEGWR